MTNIYWELLHLREKLAKKQQGENGENGENGTTTINNYTGGSGAGLGKIIELAMQALENVPKHRVGNTDTFDYRFE